MPFKILGPMVEAGAYSFLYLHMQSPATAGSLNGVEAWALTPERIASTIGLAVFIGFYGGRIWRDFINSKGKIANDDSRIKNIESLVTDIKMDLIGRRAYVDKEMSHLQWELESLKARQGLIETRHNRLRDTHNRLVGSLAPVLKDMDVDLSRLDLVQKLVATAHGDRPEEATSEERES